MIRIMVVDDEKDIEPLFKQRFRNEIKNGDLDFYFAFSAEEALKYLNTARAADIVLILSDINMPGMNGIELLRIIKKDYAHLKVFMITAYDDKEKHEQAFEFGASEYLTKPIDFENLKKTIFSLKNKES
jgi:CheY-like chemotaxis protein